jgi:hypothetical protein
MRTLREAQNRLPELVDEARADVIGLMNEAGNLVGLLAGLTDDDLDDLLVETPAFQAMLARARASIQAGRLIPADEVLEEMTARLAREEAQQYNLASLPNYTAGIGITSRWAITVGRSRTLDKDNHR